MRDPVLIWSMEHNAWWASGECGYVPDRGDAGVYERDRAQQIVDGSRGENERIEEMFPGDHLHRAAPELLAACEALTDALERFGQDVPGIVGAVLEQARAAIAKAKGGAL